MLSSFLIKLILRLSKRKFIDVYYNVYKDNKSINYASTGCAYYTREEAVKEGSAQSAYVGTIRLTTKFRLTDEI